MLLTETALAAPCVISCGTLLINKKSEILLCHVTGYEHFDIPKGCMNPSETPLEAARRELEEETGLVLNHLVFTDLGEFHYKAHKRLHLYKVHVPDDLVKLDCLTCTSHFRHYRTGKMCPEMDGYRWAAREELPMLCNADMVKRLLSLSW